MNTLQRTLLVSLLFVGIISNANASLVTFDYVSNQMFNITNPDTGTSFETNAVGDNIRITAVFNNPIDNSNNTAITVTMTDGIKTISDDISSLNFQPTISNSGFDIEDGKIINWSLDFRIPQFNAGGESGLLTFFASQGNARSQSFDRASNSVLNFEDFQFTTTGAKANFGNPGVWTLREEQISSVPVPASLPLMASALGLFGFAKRHQQSV